MDFRMLPSGRGWLHYAAFDLLWLNGRDLRGQPLIKRKRKLEQLIPTNNSTLSRVLAVEEHGRELFEAAQRLDLEGIVAKRRTIRALLRPSGTRSRIPPTPKLRAEGTCSSEIAGEPVHTNAQASHLEGVDAQPACV
jgi:hypothetical protein